MISALFYGKGGFDHVLFMVNKTLPRPVIPVRRAWEFISRSFGNGIKLDRRSRYLEVPGVAKPASC
jgi:hypothetical protein